ncbi:hypothetical protein [Absidia glauca]|uniref:NADP-dependent oxidoreductase domain-containing protein n=1 Tax=Absidia glauca TaxID=4829 RepID=A0A168L6W5_ABSGL|nr:hypothetical protein [Absidia glauca]
MGQSRHSLDSLSKTTLSLIGYVWASTVTKADKSEQRSKKSTLAHRLNCSPAQLAIAWCLAHPHVTSVILGASTPAQAAENAQALKLRSLLTTEIMHELDQILANKPEDVFDFRKS